jgi:predicted protein tyrosine phosphatase
MAFAIYDLAVGGGRLGIAPMPNEGQGLDAITAWGAALVISMTTKAELKAARIPSLGRVLNHRGIKWYHVPVEDYGVPETKPQARSENSPFAIGPGSVQEIWDVAAKNASKEIADGGRVLVHCKGGCGRSGMAALRLMILAGEPPEAALARLRDVRPCAVETDEQAAWALRPV